MQVTLDESRRIIQHGTSLGERDGCTTEDVSDEHTPAVLDALNQRPDGGHVVLSADHGEVSITEPTAEWLAAVAARQAAQEQRTADLATIQDYAAGQPDPHWQALARLVTG